MDYKVLMTQVQKTLDSIETGDNRSLAITRIAETIARNFRAELGITGGRLYEWREDAYELMYRFGDSYEGEIGIRVPADYAPIAQALENGVVVMAQSDPGVDRELEERVGANRFAAVSVGDDEYILSFDVPVSASREDILFSLNLIRYVINQKIRAERYESIMVEAQRIQQSILPQRMPVFRGFDIFGRTIPAEIVGGDFYDFIPISDDVLGLAIADASGHGLPAALVVRDIYMGLRMASDRDFKIIRSLQKLNQIIHRGRLTTKFVTLFYGELEVGGTFIYSNAGHNPPFLLKGHRFQNLWEGGTVLGPTPDATYRRGFVLLDPGDLVCMYSDGITEAHDAKDREFGLDRLQRIVKANRDLSAKEIGLEVLRRVDRWGRRSEDDRTIVIVKALKES